MKKTLGRMGRLGAILALVAGAILGSASVASAATLPESVPLASPVQPSGIVFMADDDNSSLEYDINIPMHRWVSGTQSFNYITDGNPVNAAARATERTIYYSFPMMTGNTMWTASATLLDGAMRFKPMQLVGYEIDQAAAGIGRAIIASPLISLAFVVIALGTIFALKRGERPWRRVWTTSLIAALFVIMVAGSASSTKVGNDYTPGTGSPGWFLNAISSTTATITSSVAKSLTIPTFETSDIGSCNKYLSTIIAGQEDDPSGVMQMASALWVQSGLEAWKMAQFGDSFYANYVYCHVLDWAYPKQAAKTLEEAGGYKEPNPESAALSPKNGEQRDRSAVAWAVCYWSESSSTWIARPGWFTNDSDGTSRWGKKDSSDTVDGDNDTRDSYAGPDGLCNDWWTKSASDWDSDKFRTGPNVNDARDFVNGETDTRGSVYTFLVNWHGAENSGIAITFSYSFSSLIISIVFIVVAAAVFFVNIAIVATMLSIFVVMLVVLFTKNDVESRLLSFVKNLIGLVVFSSIAALLIAMISKITEVLSMVGKAIFSDMPVAMMIWIGLSPLLALIMLHFVFTKLLRVPSPFKLSSALAWGAAAGAAGGAVGAGVNNAISRGENKVENAVKSAPGAAGRKIKEAAMGKKGADRDGAATPVGSTKGSEKEQIAQDGTTEKPKSAVERRAEAKAEKNEIKEAKRAARGETGDKNEGYLSAMDRISGGNGELDPARTGWRGAANKVSGFLGKGDVLSTRDTNKDGIATNLAADAGDKMVGGIKAAGANLRAVPAKMAENAREKRAQYAELWANNKGAAVKQTLKTTAKYGALGVATALTGGGAAVAYAGYRTAKSGISASRDVSRGNTRSALDTLREAKAEQQRQQAPQSQQRRGGQPQPQAQNGQPQQRRRPSGGGSSGPQPGRNNSPAGDPPRPRA